MKLDLLAIGAHPDDIELSCGGTIIKMVKKGYSVGVVDLTEGEMGTRGSREIRAAEAAESARVMGVAVRESLGLSDGNIELTEANRLRVITAIRKYRPDVLLFPYPVDRHPDHEHAHQLCREAWFSAGLEKLKTTDGGVGQEAFRPRAYYHFMQWFEFPPAFIVDVTEEYEQRTAAMKAFKSQFYNPDSRETGTVLSTPAFLEMIRTRLEYYGDKIGKRYGEPFFSPHAVAVDDPVTLNR